VVKLPSRDSPNGDAVTPDCSISNIRTPRETTTRRRPALLGAACLAVHAAKRKRAASHIPALVCALWSNIAVAEPLPQLNLDPQETTVSGLSSGAFMAVQLQVAFSSTISGAGIVAGGPFDCAQGSLWRALYVCMDPFWVEADAAESLATMQTLAEQGGIDPLADIAIDRIYLFHGRADDTVARSTMDSLAKTYSLMRVPDEALSYSFTVDAGHGFVTEEGTVACAETRPDFLIDCDIDQAGDILKWLYGDLSEPVVPRDEGLLTFDQALYTAGAPGMDDTAYVYVPAACAAGGTCRLHIALHGCKQGREVLGEDYARLTGYNRWAEANSIVVLYPQAARIPAPWYNWFAGNPNGCWDWWGYSATDYLTRTAPQPAAIARMADALGAALAR
jgi:poly(3-hydroxybutyrate) depolymerase